MSQCGFSRAQAHRGSAGEKSRCNDRSRMRVKSSQRTCGKFVVRGAVKRSSSAAQCTASRWLALYKQSGCTPAQEECRLLSLMHIPKVTVRHCTSSRTWSPAYVLTGTRAHAHAHARTKSWVCGLQFPSLILWSNKGSSIMAWHTRLCQEKEGEWGEGGVKKREIKKEGRRRDRRSRRPKKSSQQNRPGREKENVWEGERDGFSYGTNLPSLQDLVFVEAGSALCYSWLTFVAGLEDFVPHRSSHACNNTLQEKNSNKVELNVSLCIAVCTPLSLPRSVCAGPLLVVYQEVTGQCFVPLALTLECTERL